MQGPIPSVPHETSGNAATGQGMAGGRHVDPWVTRADGSFRAAPVPPGQIHVIARHPGYVESVSEATTLRAGGQASVHLVLRKGGLLEGRVIEADRTPVGRARIELTAPHGAFARIVYANDDGTFAVVGTPDEVQLSVARPDTPEDVVARRIESVPERERHEIEVVLPPLRKTVALHVSDDRGYALGRVEVHVASLDVAVPLRRTLFTDEAGDASLRDAAGLPLGFTLARPGKSPMVARVDEAPTTLNFAMSQGIVGRGVVTVREGRERLAGADVTIHTATGARRVRTNDEGAFFVRDLAPGRVRLTAHHLAYASGSAVAQVAGDADHDADSGTIDSADAGIAEGSVVDSEGNPVAGARVAQDVAPAYLPVGPLPADVVRTGRDGHFRLTRLPEGQVTLEAYSAELGRSTRRPH